MSMSARLLERGIEFWKVERRQEARRIFEAIIHNDDRCESAWVWYIYSLESDLEKIAALKRFLVLFPQHATARRALASLEREQPSAPVPPVVVTRSLEGAKHVQEEHVPVQVARPVVEPRAGYASWVLVLVGLVLLLFSMSAFLLRYNTLQNEYERLEASNQLLTQTLSQSNRDKESLQAANRGLTDQYNALVNTHNSLVGEHEALRNGYTSLQSEYSLLAGEYDALSTRHASLESSYASLQEVYNGTLQSFDAFREIAIAPPYIYTQGRNVHLVFRRRDGSLLEWMVGSEWLEYHLLRGEEQRRKLRFDLSLHNDTTGETYHVVDGRKFIDPDPFENLMADLYRRAPSDQAFLEEVWNIVAQLTAYTTEMDEKPRFPMETLLSGGGDCEDHAILFASMILAAPPPWEVKLVYMDSASPTDPYTVDHVIVQVVTPERSYLVEATGKDTMNPYYEGVTGWYFAVDGSGE